VRVVLLPAVLGHDLSLEEGVEILTVRSPSRSRSVNDSTYVFCHGEPGSMSTMPVGLAVGQQLARTECSWESEEAALLSVYASVSGMLAQ